MPVTKQNREKLYPRKEQVDERGKGDENSNYFN